MNASTNTPTKPSYRPMSELCDLWNQLSEVPVSGAGDALDAPFLHFDKGTDVAGIWRWFEEQNALFKVEAAGSRIGTDHPLRKPGLVEQALSHIMKIHPSVTQVVYDDDLRWNYSNSQGLAVTFNKQEDIDLLNEAADEAYERGLQNIPVTL